MRLSPTHWASWLQFGVFLGVACTNPTSTTTEGADTTTGNMDCSVGSVGCQCTPGGTCDGNLVCASKICVPLDDTSTGVTETNTDTDQPTAGTDTSVGECGAGERPAQRGLRARRALLQHAGRLCAVLRHRQLRGDRSGHAGLRRDQRPAALPAPRATRSGCTGATPVCDPETQTCHACTQHEECTSGACDIATGACFPAGTRCQVDGAGDCDDAGSGSEAEPLCTISEALTRIAVEPQAVLVRPAVYDEPLAVPAMSVVAIVRVGDGAVEITGSADATLGLGSQARVYLDGLEIRDNELGSGVACDAGELWIDRSRIRQHHVSGVSAVDCDVRVRASVLYKNLGEGVFASGGSVKLENSFITENGDKANADNPRGGVALAGGAAATLVYVTLVGNNAYTGGGLSVECEPDAGAEVGQPAQLDRLQRRRLQHLQLRGRRGRVALGVLGCDRRAQRRQPRGGDGRGADARDRRHGDPGCLPADAGHQARRRGDVRRGRPRRRLRGRPAADRRTQLPRGGSAPP